jgi:hypothetical protein
MNGDPFSSIEEMQRQLMDFRERNLLHNVALQLPTTQPLAPPPAAWTGAGAADVVDLVAAEQQPRADAAPVSNNIHSIENPVWTVTAQAHSVPGGPLSQLQAAGYPAAAAFSTDFAQQQQPNQNNNSSNHDHSSQPYQDPAGDAVAQPASQPAQQQPTSGLEPITSGTQRFALWDMLSEQWRVAQDMLARFTGRNAGEIQAMELAQQQQLYQQHQLQQQRRHGFRSIGYGQQSATSPLQRQVPYSFASPQAESNTNAKAGLKAVLDGLETSKGGQAEVDVPEVYSSF